MSDPTVGLGTVIEVDRGSGYEPIVRLAEIGEIGAELDDIEITVHGDVCRRYMPGYVTVRSIGFSGLWVAHPSQVALFEDALSRNWDDETVDVLQSCRGGLLAALLVGFEVVPAFVTWPALAAVRSAFFAAQTEAGRVARALARGPILVDPGAVPHPPVFEAVALGGRPLAPLPALPRVIPAALASVPGPRRLWYVTDARGAAELAVRGLAASRPASLAGPSVLLVVR